ncbi:MAG TPA: family 1 encapsulin nanocompartment shell protein [Solirubrobacteraceae bacterium]|nr:family 1 encapsulin nanocompartment shell protein [Solirubrobacteraceae bacterium]
MSTSHLLREHAPITGAGWKLIDAEARERLLPGLAVRRLVDFSGPHGWEHSATNLGRVERTNVSELKGVEAHRRVVMPLVELRARFTVSREELRDGDRGAENVDFVSLDAAAQRIVDAENVAVFHAWPKAGIEGITASTPHKPIVRKRSFEDYPGCVARAVELLLRNGIAGPYGLALGREDYTSVVETAEHGGYPLLDHLRNVIKGPIAWAPGVNGAVVLSMRGGDFAFESGEDLSVGYESHDTEQVSLYIEESCSFRVLTPEAAVAITPPKGR